MNYKPEDLPFRLDKSHRATLTDQLVDGIRQAISNGFLKEGDRLPSREALAACYGVSLCVPRIAFRRLKTEGAIITRSRLGCFVAKASGSKKWKGVVLYARYAESEGLAVEVEVRRRLDASGYLLLPVGIRQKTKNSFDFSAVERCLEFPLSLIIVACHHPVIRRWFARLGVPHVIAGGEKGVDGCVGVIPAADNSAPREAFVEQCVARGVKNVLQVGFSFPGSLNLRPQLEKAGVACDVWTIPPLRGLSRRDGVVQATLKAFSRRFEQEGRSWLPEVILFADDYVAMGALAAFAAFHIRVPEDVRFATLINEGSRIPYAKTLTAFVWNPKVAAFRIVRPALEYLTKSTIQQETPICVYERGETFP